MPRWRRIIGTCASTSRSGTWPVRVQVQVQRPRRPQTRLEYHDTTGFIKNRSGAMCLRAPLIDEKAGIVNDPIIVCLAPDRFWLSISDTDVLLWVKGLAVGAGFDVEVTDPNVFPLSLQGPQSERLLGRLIAEPLGDIRFFRFAETHTLTRNTSGLSAHGLERRRGGFELYLSDSCEGEQLWGLLVDAGDGLNLRSGCP